MADIKIDPTFVIEELNTRVQVLTTENVMLKAYITQLQKAEPEYREGHDGTET